VIADVLFQPSECGTLGTIGAQQVGLLPPNMVLFVSPKSYSLHGRMLPQNRDFCLRALCASVVIFGFLFASIRPAAAWRLPDRAVAWRRWIHGHQRQSCCVAKTKTAEDS
jgi:hypothetical protein